MTNDPDWYYEYFSDSEIDSFYAKSERIIEDMNTYYQVYLAAPRDAVISACRHYAKARNGNMDSIAFCGFLLEAIFDSLEEALIIDDINPYDD